MPDRKATPQELARYVRNYVTEQKASGKTWAAIGKTLGIGHSRVIQIANPQKYGDVRVGPEVLNALADELHKGSLDKLHAAAAEWAAKHPDAPGRVTVGTPRYDAREAAIQTHIRYGEHDEVTIRAAADAVAVALHAGDDPGERWWYEQIDAELKRTRPRLGVRVIAEDDEPKPRKKTTQR